MAEKKERYVVAKGVSFIGDKKQYFEGDGITESAFKNPEYFKKMISGKNPKIVLAPPVTEKEEPKKLDRKELEELAVKNNLAKKEQVSSLKGEELEKLLKDAGLLK